MDWYTNGTWNVDAIRALFARARTRRFGRGGYEALPLDRWALRPPATAESVETVEAGLGVQLPDGYRSFLLQVSDGAPGPGESIWPVAGREDGGPDGHNAEDPAGPFDLDGPVARVIYGDDDPASDEYWENATFVRLTGVLDIGTFGDPYDIFLVLTGSRRGDVWSVDEDRYYPLSDNGVDSTDGRGFVRWYCEWLDELYTDPQQLVQVPEDAIPTVAAIGRLVQYRPDDASEQLIALIDGGDHAVAACGLRVLGLVDPGLGRQRAESLLEHSDPRVAEAAFDVVVALAEESDLPLLGQMIRAAGAAGRIATDNPERLHLEQGLHRLGPPGRELLAKLWLDDQLDRETTREELNEFRTQMLEWERSGQPGPPRGSLPDLAGMGPPTGADAAKLAADIRETADLLQEALGENFDWHAITEMQATLLSAVDDQVSDEVRDKIARAFAALRPPTRSGQPPGDEDD